MGLSASGKQGSRRSGAMAIGPMVAIVIIQASNQLDTSEGPGDHTR